MLPILFCLSLQRAWVWNSHLPTSNVYRHTDRNPVSDSLPHTQTADQGALEVTHLVSKQATGDNKQAPEVTHLVSKQATGDNQQALEVTILVSKQATGDNQQALEVTIQEPSPGTISGSDYKQALEDTIQGSHEGSSEGMMPCRLF